MAMKKTLTVVATLLLATGLVLTGCPTSGGGNDGDIGVGGDQTKGKTFCWNQATT